MSRALARTPAASLFALALAACSKAGSESDSVGTSTTVDGNAALVQHGEVVCTDPTLRDLGPFSRTQTPSPESDLAWVYAGGAIAADLDGDGGLDIVAPNMQPEAQLYLSTAGPIFAERGDVLSAFDLSFGTGGTAVDYDADGDLDLYITRYTKANVLLRNDGDLSFVDVTGEAGLSACDPDGTCYRSASSSWADFDRDGDLDLVVGNYGFVPHDGTLAADLDPGEPSFLYRNDGSGLFTDISESVFPRATMPQVHDGFTYVSAFVDLDRDGWPELYFINDFGTGYPNVLLRNDAGTLTPDGNRRGLDIAMTGMCLAVQDGNGDGLPDLLISEWDKLRILQSDQGSGFWVSVQAGEVGLVPLAPQKVPWGCEYADLDLDGDEDVVQAYGFVRNDGTVNWTNPLMQPDAVYIRGGTGRFLDMAPLWGMDDTGVGRGFLVADFNRDGYLDVFKRDPKGPDVQYTSRCGPGSWLQIALRQPGTGNTHAVGAIVEVDVGGSTMRRWVAAGGRNFASSPSLDVHFGLGDAARADAIRVYWPDGEVSTFEGVAGRQRLTISRRKPS